MKNVKSLTSFAAILTASKESIDKALLPIKIREMQAKGEIAMTQIESDLVGAERNLQEYLATKSIDFSTLASKLDSIAILERKLNQHQEIMTQLFPKTKAKAKKATVAKKKAKK